MKFLIGRKLEMSQTFRDDGSVVPVTMVEVLPATVTQLKTAETDGYAAVQIGVGQRKHVVKPLAGHLKDLPAHEVLREFRVEQTDLKRGDALTVELFVAGDRVDVVGRSKGHGFQGVVKRHGFSGSPASHGHKDQLRMPGSIGSRRQGPIAKGKRMGGHMGDERVTIKNLEVVAVDVQKQQLAIKGAVPGARGSVLLITSRTGKRVWQP